MKNLILIFCMLFAFSWNTKAQENKTIKEETTVRKVVKREGSQVIVTKVEEVKKEKGSVVVTGNDDENQGFTEDATVTDDENVLVDEVVIDEKNEAKIAAVKKKQEEELRNSIAEAKAKADEERKILEKLNKERMEALEKKRKDLERRPKGMTKLKKGNN